jgi:hypothetical protein
MFYKWIEWQLEACGLGNFISMYIEARVKTPRPIKVMVVGGMMVDHSPYFRMEQAHKDTALIMGMPMYSPINKEDMKALELAVKPIRDFLSFVQMERPKKEHNWKKKQYFGRTRK